MDPELQDSLGELLARIGPAGLLALLIWIWIKLSPKTRKEIRNKIWSWVRWLARQLWYLVCVAWWAARNKIPFRLALRLQPDRWNAMVERRKLPGLKRGKIRRTATGVSVRLTLTGSLTSQWVVSKLPQLETGLGLRKKSTRLRHVGRADHLVLEIKLRDAVQEFIPWSRPRGKVRLRDPLRFALTEFGDVVSVSVKNRIGIFGGSGNGKSCAQRLIGAHVIMAVDAGLEIWDLKFGTESQHYINKAHRVTTVPDSLARLDWLIDEEFPRRAVRMRELRTSSWKETEQDPALLIIVDEGNVITREYTPAQMARFFRAVEQGRALGVYFVWATQFPKAKNLPTEIRSQLNVKICFGLETKEESLVVFKEGVNDGWTPHALPGPGWCMIKSKDPDHLRPRDTKAVWLDDTDLRDNIKMVGKIPGRTPAPDAVEQADETAPEPGAPSVTDDIWAVLLTSPAPLGVSELARRTARSKAAVHAALKKMAASGAVRQDGLKYFVPTVDREHEGD